MIASFFRSLDSHEVAYLLISGQATVLYGAATFSENIDLWIAPEARNINLFRAALRESGAHYLSSRRRSKNLISDPVTASISCSKPQVPLRSSST